MEGPAASDTFKYEFVQNWDMFPVLRLLGLAIAAVLSSASVSAKQPNILDDVFAPFGGIDFSQTYDSYSSIIDFVVYATLFVGVSQATIGKRFEGRGGKAVVSSIGMILAIGLSISESMLGFNLRSFGPLAAGLFIFLVGFTLYLGIKTAGMNTVNAGSIALVVTYFSIRAVAPGFFDWMMGNPYTSWIHAVVLIAVVIAAYRMIRCILPGRDTDLKAEAKELLGKATQAPRELVDQMHAEKHEKDFMKAHLEKITEAAGKTSRQILEDLQAMRKLIEQFGATSKGQFLIAAKIEAIAPKEHQVIRSLRKLKEMVNRLSRFDHQHYDKLRAEWHKLSAKARKQIEDEMRDEWKKLQAEEEIKRLEEVVARYDQNFKHAVRMISTSLKTNRQQEALSWTDQAIKWEKQVQKALQEIEALEHKLVRYTRQEIKDEKKEVKNLEQAKNAT